METDKSCPFCKSPSVRLWDGVLRVRTVSEVGGGPGEDRACLVFRCLTRGRGFEETEMATEEGPEPKWDDGSSFD
jgi:hypothetical protein